MAAEHKFQHQRFFGDKAKPGRVQSRDSSQDQVWSSDEGVSLEKQVYIQVELHRGHSSGSPAGRGTALAPLSPSPSARPLLRRAEDIITALHSAPVIAGRCRTAAGPRVALGSHCSAWGRQQCWS